MCLEVQKYITIQCLQALYNLAPFGACSASDTYCFGRLPSELQEQSSEMLGIDGAGTIYR